MIRAVGPDPTFGKSVQAEISARITEQQFLTWFQRVQFRVSSTDVVTVSVPNRFFMTFLKHRYQALICDAVSAVSSIRQPRVEFEIVEDEAVGRLPHAAAPPPVIAPAAINNSHGAGQAPEFPENIPLNPDYTFDEFVVGPSNRLAHAAALSVSETPGTSYNPLFLFGSVGLGKTHLMQAVARRYGAAGMGQMVYISCASFTNDFIAAVSNNDLDRFRRKYREANALLIDDIHFLANKERTQEEFFHTFNSIYNRQKQILLTSDSLPSEIAGLGDRLVSRFKLGLVVELAPPCFETRVAILLRKARNVDLEIPLDVAEYVAHRICDNVRELEGAVNRLHSHVHIEHRALTIEEARKSIADLVGDEEHRVDLLRIQQAILEQFSIRPSDLHSKCRSRSVVVPRQICMYLSRLHTDLSLGEIGLYFGGRDHSTVLHSIEKIRKLLETDSALRSTVAALERKLGHRR
ncbi:MAG: chromosomal replication initiator protein DnaA [Planctomycetes bacterium]|nr:chromosomal replication initiator protein DnaA [Planctomycetota bacterium]